MDPLIARLASRVVSDSDDDDALAVPTRSNARVLAAKNARTSRRAIDAERRAEKSRSELSQLRKRQRQQIKRITPR